MATFPQSGRRAVDVWYTGSALYRPGGPFNSKIGTFTQLVWKTTEKLGVGRAIGKNGQFYVLAVYSPRGNVNYESDSRKYVSTVNEAKSLYHRNQTNNWVNSSDSTRWHYKKGRVEILIKKI